MEQQQAGSLVQYLKRAFRLVVSVSGYKPYKIVSLTIVSGIMDVAGVAILLPLIYVILDRSILEKNAQFAWLYEFMGFADYNKFVYTILGGVIAFIAVKNVIGLWINKVQLSYCYRLSTNVSSRILFRIFDRGYQKAIETSQAELWRDVIVNPYNFGISVITSALYLLTELVIVVIILLGISIYSINILLLILISLGPVSWWTYRNFKKKVQLLGEQKNDIYKDTNASLLNILNGLSEIEIMHKEEFFITKYRKLRRLLDENETSTSIIGFIPARLIEVIAVMAVAIIVVFHLVNGDGSAAILATLTIFTASAYRLMPSINRIFNNALKIKNNTYTVDILESYDLDTPKQISESHPLTFSKGIDFKDVSFTYTNKPVLEEISFSLEKGQCVGFIGESGSGKTTLIKLLLRFLTEQKGGIFVDGHRLDIHNLLSWRHKVAFVQQNVFILNETIRENIAFGIKAEEVDQAKLKQAIKDAQLQDFVESLPDKELTKLGDYGGNISGGQKQRIGIARALYRGSEILVLDEITSALDHQTEKEIVDNIIHLKRQHKTIFIIAHRLSTLKYCDKIYELQHGKIARKIQYDELVSKG